jgi:hypothetical protein
MTTSEHVGIETKNARPGTFPSEFVAAPQETMTARANFSSNQRVVGAWSYAVPNYEAHRNWPNRTRAPVVQGYSDDQIRWFLTGQSLLIFRGAGG